jgi:crotonobetainyl-CoA:carnitine CoA-transferase CaiB-like acyl-CoA transferase
MAEPVELLKGFVVADLGAGMAAALVTKFLADCGASVIRVEAAADPFYNYYPAYEVWHRNARRDQAAATDLAKLHELLAAADICVTGGEDYPGFTHRRDPAALAAANPTLIILDIAAEAQGLPESTGPANEVLVQARSGICFEQLPDRPILMGFRPAIYGAALQGLSALLAALYERENGGEGQITTTSLFEGALTWTTMFWGDFEKPTPRANFVIPRGPRPLVFRCADGKYIHFVIGAAGSKYKVYELLKIEGHTVKPNDLSTPDAAGPMEKFFGDVDLFRNHIEKWNSQDLLAAMAAAGVPAEPVLAPGACWDLPQTAVNGVIVTDADGTRHVGSPIIARVAGGDVAPKHRPMEQLRVIDFGVFLAGPLASGVLADLGADVIKIEPPAGDPNRAVTRGYMAANRGKRGIMLDMKSPADLKTAQELALNADIITSNFRSGASARLGIDPATLHAQRPALIILESPAYGSTGPLAQNPGFDMVMQAVCGHEVRAGGIGNPPLWSRTSMIDYAGGMVGAISLLAALVYRARTGKGVSLDVPLFNAGIFLLSELIQLPNGNFVGGEPINARQTGFSVSEAMYHAKDGWLAIAAPGAAAATLAAVLGIAGQMPVDATSWAEPQAVLIADAVAGWTISELQAALQANGVWAEPCRQDAEQKILASTRARISIDSQLGRTREIGPLYQFSRPRKINDRPVNKIGEHNDEVLKAHAQAAE